MEEKELKFERLAEKRVSDAIKRLRLIGNLSNKSNYSYKDDHVKQIIDALESELKLLKAKFKDDLEQEIVSFSFKKTKNQKQGA